MQTEQCKQYSRITDINASRCFGQRCQWTENHVWLCYFYQVNDSSSTHKVFASLRYGVHSFMTHVTCHTGLALALKGIAINPLDPGYLNVYWQFDNIAENWNTLHDTLFWLLLQHWQLGGSWSHEHKHVHLPSTEREYIQRKREHTMQRSFVPYACHYKERNRWMFLLNLSERCIWFSIELLLLFHFENNILDLLLCNY